MNFIELLNKLIQVSGNIVVAILLLSVLLCLFNFKKLSLPFRRLFYFLVLNLTIEILARAFAYSKMNNLPLLHVYTLGEFVLLSYFYKSLIVKPAWVKSKFWYFIIGGALLIVLNSIFLERIYEFNPQAKTFVQTSIISYAVLYFYNLTENQFLSPDVGKSLRLINSAVLIYYSGSLFIFMCNQIFLDNSELYKIFWAFNAVLNFVFQVLILWGIWKAIFRKTPSSS